MRQLIALMLVVASSAGYGQALLKPKGEGFEPLVQKSLEVEGRVEGGFASTRVQMVFANPAKRRTEAEFVYTLPEGAVATGFAYWFKDEKVVARVVEKERAAEIYRAITTWQQDPALIELVGKRTFRARIFPVEPGADLRVEMTWVSFLAADAGGLTYTVPLAVRERQPMAVDVRVRVTAGPGLGAPANNYGLAFAGGKLALQGDALRSDKDLRIRIPVVSRPYVGVFSGRSGGPGGFFAMLVVGAKPGAIPGATAMRIVGAKGGAWHVTGRYAAPRRVTVAGRTVELSGAPRPNHLGVKLWAAGEIERLGNRRAAVVAVSERHTLPSRFTSWLAIPSGERERFAQEIRTAKARLLGVKYAEQVRRFGAGSRSARRTWAELSKEAKALGMDPRVFRADAWEVVEREAARRGDEVARLIRAGKDREALQAMEAFERFSTALTGNRRSLQNQMPVYEALQGLATTILQNARAEGEASPAAKRARERLQSLVGREMAHSFVVNEVRSEIGAIQSKFDKLFLKGEEDSPEGRRLLERLRWYGRQAGSEIPVFGYAAKDALMEASGLRLKKSVGESVSEEELARGDALLNRARAIAPQSTSDAESRGYQNAAYGLRRGRELNFAATVAKKGRTSPAAREAEARVLRVPVPEGFGDQGRNLAFVLERVVHDSFDRFLQDLREGVAPKQAAAEYRRRLASYRSDDPEVRRLEEPVLKGMAERAEAWNSDSAFKIVVFEESRLFPKRERIVEARRLVAGLRELGYRSGNTQATSFGGATDWAHHYPELAARYRAGRFDDAETRVLEAKAWNEIKRYNPSDPWPRETVFERMRVNALLDAAEAAPATPENQALVAELRKRDQALRVRFGDPWIRLDFPWTTVSAVATLPWGETRTLVRLGTSRTWQARFDVPPTAAPGPQRARVEVRTSEGRAFTTWQSFTVDLTAPKVRVAWSGKRLEVQDLGGDVVRVKAVLPEGAPVNLHRAANGRWWADLPAVPVEVVALDAAHNLARWKGSPLPSPRGGAQKLDAEFHGNVQTLATAFGTVFAGTLDEGLWRRDARAGWHPVPGLPSGAPRDLTPFRGGLAVRFGDGELVWLTPAGAVRLDRQLPRRQALGLAEHGGTLFVAQTGGWSEFDGQRWTHRFEVPELSGLAPSALAATESSLLFAAQGRGFATLDRATGKVAWTDERQGLTDDWVTVVRDGLAGTFVGGALSVSGAGWNHLSETGDAHVTAVLADRPGAWWVGTRKGLFRVAGGRATKVADLEVQALARAGGDLWVGTRDGAAIVRIATP